MADDQQGAAVGPQETHEPVLGVAVEMVGRLVEEEHVAPGKQDAGQLDPAPFAPGKDPERTIDAIGAQAESGHDLANFGLGGVTALRREGVFSPGEAGDGSFGGLLLHGDPQLLQLGGSLVQAPPRQDMGQAGSGAGVPGAPRILTEEADPPPHGHGAGCGRHLSAEHLEQAGLARSVAPDETYFVTGAHQERRLLQREAPSYFHAQLAGLEHPSMMADRPDEPVTDYGPRVTRVSWRRLQDRRWRPAPRRRSPRTAGGRPPRPAGPPRVPAGAAGPPPGPHRHVRL